MMVGLITYHAAYNYGSVLQAYATQCAVERIGYSVEIINYRMAEQKHVYSLYRTKFGIKTLIKDLLQIPIYIHRKERCAKFEQFIAQYMRLSTEYSTPEEVKNCWNKYNQIVSGSDQIWNKHSLELENNEWIYMEPYLLAGYRGGKISYASSVANMSDDELLKIKQNVIEFNNVSLREISSVRRVEDILGIEVKNVLDPTFLLTKTEWIEMLELEKSSKEGYILYYSLESYGTFRKNLELLKKIARREKKKVLIVSPFVYIPTCDKRVKMCPMLGPSEFLNAIYNAEKVITNSYHGTILSINFEKDVYSLCEAKGAEFRKTDILKQLGMDARIIDNLNLYMNTHFEDIDYVSVNDKLKTLRVNSEAYLREALCINE